MTMTEEARKQRIEEALVAHGEQTAPRYLRIPWQGAQEDFPVISLPLDAVVLRHSSHRIRAQVESSPQRELIENEPFGEDAQRLLAEILRDTDGYEELKT